MRFLVDMGLSNRVAEFLRMQRHDVVHLREQGLDRMPDDEVFALALEQDRVVLTCDLDFGEIVALSRGKSASVVVFRLANPRTDRVLARLERVLKDSASALESGAIIVVEEARHRVRRLPIGA